jgi:hypothetical protein
MSCCAPMAAACSRAYRGWFAGVVFEWRERPFSVVGFTVRRGRIVEIDVLADPDRLRRLEIDVLDD